MTAPSTVASVERALEILKAFGRRKGTLSLSDLAELTGFYKSTLLRLLQTLEAQSFVTRLSTGLYQLGPALQYLARAYQRTFLLEPLIMPVLAELTAFTNESASFFVANGDVRSCLFRVEPDRPVRHTVEVGEALPLFAGASGKVFQDFGDTDAGPTGTRDVEIPVIRLGGGKEEITVIAGPILQNGAELAGAICISGPAMRFDKKAALQVSPALLAAIKKLTRQLGGEERLLDKQPAEPPQKRRRKPPSRSPAG